jgi:glycosyltransferase involved in cell wall biosynthesis
MTFNPKVTIVIPVYNGSDYLQEAIESALAQTYQNLEIIIVNDGSLDERKTERIALSYGDKIRYFSKENGGVASALNLGIKKMEGDYFSWLSHDDLYYPEKIKSQVEYLGCIEDKSVIIYSDFSYIDEYSHLLSHNPVKHVPPEHFRPAFITGRLINGCTLFIPKICFETCGRFNEELKTTQDYDLWFRFSEKFSFVHQPEILVKSRLHQNQGSVKLKPIMSVEGNRLLIRFIKKIKYDEIKLYCKKPIPIFYIDSSLIIFENQFYRAANFAFFLSLVNFWRLEPVYVYEYLIKVKRVLKSNFKLLFRK